MNGRMYDPLVGRFLSPDPYVQDGTSTQNMNRYSYCLNNPLKFTDPSGYRMAAADEGRNLGAVHYEWYTGTHHYGHSINGTGGADVGDWVSAYRSAVTSGYSGGAAEFHRSYYNQLYSDDYDGTMTFQAHTFTHSSYVDKNNVPTAVSTRHDFTIKTKLNSLLSNSLCVTDIINTLYDENATRNLKAIEKEAAAFGKVTHSIRKTMDGNKFTKVITKSIGKKLYGAGLVFSVIDMYQDPSINNIAWNVADGLVGLAAFVPGLQIPAAIYFTGRITYDVIDEY